MEANIRRQELYGQRRCLCGGRGSGQRERLELTSGSRHSGLVKYRALEGPAQKPKRNQSRRGSPVRRRMPAPEEARHLPNWLSRSRYRSRKLLSGHGSATITCDGLFLVRVARCSKAFRDGRQAAKPLVLAVLTAHEKQIKFFDGKTRCSTKCGPWGPPPGPSRSTASKSKQIKFRMLVGMPRWWAQECNYKSSKSHLVRNRGVDRQDYVFAFGSAQGYAL
jgi:hypothetical protein